MPRRKKYLKLFPSEVVRAGKKISKDRMARLDSEEARIMKNFYYDILPKEPILQKKWEEAEKMAQEHWVEGKTLRQIAKEKKLSIGGVKQKIATIGGPTRTYSEYWENITPEQKQEKLRRLQEYWENIAPEQKQQISEKISKALKEYWEKLTPEQKQQISEKNREIWENLPPEQKQQITNKISRSHTVKFHALPKKIKEEWRNHFIDWITGKIPNEEMSYIMTRIWDEVGLLPPEIQPYDAIKKGKRKRKKKDRQNEDE
ncbi:MAG: DUF3106 domain-containing protein [archaeon]